MGQNPSAERLGPGQTVSSRRRRQQESVVHTRDRRKYRTSEDNTYPFLQPPKDLTDPFFGSNDSKTEGNEALFPEFNEHDEHVSDTDTDDSYSDDSEDFDPEQLIRQKPRAAPSMHKNPPKDDHKPSSRIEALKSRKFPKLPKFDTPNPVSWIFDKVEKSRSNRLKGHGRIKTNSVPAVEDFSSKSVNEISRAIKVDPTLLHLYLPWKNLGDSGVVQIAKALKFNTCLLVLDLGFNNLSDVGSEALAETIETNNQLAMQELNLENNFLSDSGAKHLLRAVEHNTSILILNFNDNPNVSSTLQAMARQIGLRDALCVQDNEDGFVAFTDIETNHFTEDTHLTNTELDDVDAVTNNLHDPHDQFKSLQRPSASNNEHSSDPLQEFSSTRSQFDRDFEQLGSESTNTRSSFDDPYTSTLESDDFPPQAFTDILTTGESFKKYRTIAQVASYYSCKTRFIWCDQHLKCLYWHTHVVEDTSKAKGFAQLDQIESVSTKKSRHCSSCPAFVQRFRENEECCISIKVPGRTLDLEAATPLIRERWARALISARKYQIRARNKKKSEQIKMRDRIYKDELKEQKKRADQSDEWSDSDQEQNDSFPDNLGEYVTDFTSYGVPSKSKDDPMRPKRDTLGTGELLGDTLNPRVAREQLDDHVEDEILDRKRLEEFDEKESSASMSRRTRVKIEERMEQKSPKHKWRSRLGVGRTNNDEQQVHQPETNPLQVGDLVVEQPGKPGPRARPSVRIGEEGPMDGEMEGEDEEVMEPRSSKPERINDANYGEQGTESLVQKIKRYLDYDEEMFAEVCEQGQLYLHGSMSSKAYYGFVLVAFGPYAPEILPELLNVIPNPERRKSMERLVNRKGRIRIPKQNCPKREGIPPLERSDLPKLEKIQIPEQSTSSSTSSHPPKHPLHHQEEADVDESEEEMIEASQTDLHDTSSLGNAGQESTNEEYARRLPTPAGAPFTTSQNPPPTHPNIHTILQEESEQDEQDFDEKPGQKQPGQEQPGLEQPGQEKPDQHQPPKEQEESGSEKPSLMDMVMEALDHDIERFLPFRESSHKFRNGNLGSHQYCENFMEVFGMENACRMFEALCDALPDQSVRGELEECFGALKGESPCPHYFPKIKTEQEKKNEAAFGDAISMSEDFLQDKARNQQVEDQEWKRRHIEITKQREEAKRLREAVRAKRAEEERKKLDEERRKLEEERQKLETEKARRRKERKKREKRKKEEKKKERVRKKQEERLRKAEEEERKKDDELKRKEREEAEQILREQETLLREQQEQQRRQREARLKRNHVKKLKQEKKKAAEGTDQFQYHRKKVPKHFTQQYFQQQYKNQTSNKPPPPQHRDNIPRTKPAPPQPVPPQHPHSTPHPHPHFSMHTQHSRSAHSTHHAHSHSHCTSAPSTPTVYHNEPQTSSSTHSYVPLVEKDPALDPSLPNLDHLDEETRQRVIQRRRKEHGEIKRRQEERVQQVKEDAARAEAERKLQNEMQGSISGAVNTWVSHSGVYLRKKGEIRALLSSLHSVFPFFEPPNKFAVPRDAKPVQVKKAYMKALLTIHPDKQGNAPLEQKLRASSVFAAIRECYQRYMDSAT